MPKTVKWGEGKKGGGKDEMVSWLVGDADVDGTDKMGDSMRLLTGQCNRREIMRS